MKTKSRVLSEKILSRGNISPIPPYIFPVKKVRRNRLVDYDQNTYIDFYLQEGTIILGYKPKLLSMAIHNRLSMGYLGGFYSHLYSRALQSLELFFPKNVAENFSFYLFPSTQERDNFLSKENLNTNKYLPLSILQPLVTDNKAIYVADRSFSNGVPLNIVLIPKSFSSSYTPSLDFSPLALESLLQTLKIVKKKSVALMLEIMMKPYKDFVQKELPHIWNLKIDKEKWALIAPSLLKEGLIVNPNKPKIAVCTETTKADLHYLFSYLKPFF